MREPLTATTALRSTPPLPSSTLAARTVTGCWALASAVAAKSPANPASAAAAEATAIDRMRNLLVFIAGIGANDLLAARKRRLDELAAARPIFHRMNGHRDRIARLYGVGTHAHGDEPPGRAQFNRPQHRLAGLLVIHHDAKPRVRIDPFEFLHRTLQGDGLLGIEHGEGMVRNCGHCERGYRNGTEADDFQVHGCLPTDLAN